MPSRLIPLRPCEVALAALAFIAGVGFAEPGSAMERTWPSVQTVSPDAPDGLHGRSAPPSGRPAFETLLLEVEVNGVAVPGIVQAEQMSDGRLAIPRQAWAAARLRSVGSPIDLPDGRSGYILEAVSGLTYQLKRDRLTLSITAPEDAFETATVGLGRGAGGALTPSALGFYLNYDLNYVQPTAGNPTYGAILEGVAVGRFGAISSSALVRDDPRAAPKTIRTDTYWRRDFPGRMETLVVGDTISSGGAWSRPVRYAGIRYGRDFSLAPGYLTYPLPTIRGSAALPSTVDVLVNNHRRQGGVKVGPGAFELTDVPVITGAGEVNLVVRDLLGVERVISQSYYLSPRLLAQGVSDFAFEAGALRMDYGLRSNNYGDGFAAAAYRYGLTNAVTVEGRAELAHTRQAAGLEVTTRVSQLGSLRAAAAYSKAQEDGRTASRGGRYLVSFERSGPGGGGSITWEQFDRGFRQLGSLPGEALPRRRIQAAAGLSLGGYASVGLSYISQDTWEGDDFALASLTFSTSLPSDFRLGAYASTDLQRGGWSGGLTLSRPLGTRRSFSAASSRTRDGRLTNLVQASQSPPVGPGLGWRVQASDRESQLLLAGATLNTDQGQFTAEANLSRDGSANAIRLGANGAVGWTAGMPFAARRIDHRAFAVVRVGGLSNIPVYRDNQLAANTNRQGLAFVTGLRPYEANRVRVSAEDLPFNVQLGQLTHVVTPYASAGVLIDIPVRVSRNALVSLILPDGGPIPIGAEVSAGSRRFKVGLRGEVYLTDLQDRNRLSVRWPDGACEVEVGLSPDAKDEPRIGPVVCKAAP